MKTSSVLEQVDKTINSLLNERKSLLEIADALNVAGFDTPCFVCQNEKGVKSFDVKGFRKFVETQDESGLSRLYDVDVHKMSVVDIQVIAPRIEPSPVSKSKTGIIFGSKSGSRRKKAKTIKQPEKKIAHLIIGKNNVGTRKKPRVKKLPETKILYGTLILQECLICHYQWPLKYKTLCPACTFRVVTPTNNLAVTHPHLVSEYSEKNEKKANEVCVDRVKMFWWKCSKEECGHEWEAIGRYRVRNSGCPACAHRVVTPLNNLAVTHPQLAREYSMFNGELLVTQVMAGTTKLLWWDCPVCEYAYRATGHNRTAGNGCPICAAKKQSELMKERSQAKRNA